MFFEKKEIELPIVELIKLKADCYRRGSLFILSKKNIELDSPIDWHYDESSNFKWDQNKWFKNYKFPPKVGVDVKRVWEKSRFNFLPTLALDFVNSNSSTSYKSIVDIVKSYNESNRMFSGVNWFYSMDVGIRMFNCVVTMKILKSKPYDIDELELEIKKNIAKGYYHINKNLENYRDKTNNHYLCNLLGLASYLSVAEINYKHKVKVIKLINDFNRESFKQINSDGSTFEGSLYYHRLSLECFLYTYILLDDIQSRFSVGDLIKPETKERLSKMIDFYSRVQSYGTLPAIGDNDSGVIFTLGIQGEDLSFEDRRVLPELDSLISLILSDEISSGWENYGYGKLFKSLFPKFFSVRRSELITHDSVGVVDERKLNEHEDSDKELYLVDCTLDIQLDSAFKIYNYSCFGIIIIDFSICKVYLKYSNLYGCHSHSDLFHVSIFSNELCIDDNGTFEYSSFPKFNSRNKSYVAHNGPKDKTGILVDYIDGNKILSEVSIFKNGVKASVNINGVYIHRLIEWNDGKLKIQDGSNIPLDDINLNVNCFYQYGFSGFNF